MHHLQLCLVLLILCAIGCDDQAKSPPASDLHKQNPKGVVIDLAWADRLTVYTGIPRGLSTVHDGTVTFDDHQFLTESLSPSEADVKRLTQLFSQDLCLLPFSGAKLCGGFHPDYCIVWSAGDKRYRVHICLSCHEAKLFGGPEMLYCDIRDDAFAELTTILAAYKQE